MKYVLVIFALLLVSCSTAPALAPAPAPVAKSITEARQAISELQGGVLEPTYPPYCWVQPPNSELWYPCGQKSDEELGQHGH